MSAVVRQDGWVALARVRASESEPHAALPRWWLVQHVKGIVIGSIMSSCHQASFAPNVAPRLGTRSTALAQTPMYLMLY